jgi:NADH-quinone oxidoreductase subunit H
MKPLFLGLGVIFGLFFAGAYLVYVERKIIARMQRRIGPNVVGPFGLLQPIADAIKLLNKSYSRPVFSRGFIFYTFPIIAFSLHVTCWLFIPFGLNQGLANSNIGILYIMMVTNFNTYIVAISGWASNSKYALLGTLRLIAKM